MREVESNRASRAFAARIVYPRRERIQRVSAGCPADIRLSHADFVPLSYCIKDRSRLNDASTARILMKAAFYDNPGPPEVIRYGDLPTPQPKDGEVLVKVSAAALNPIDTYIRAGIVTMPRPTPTIPGCDLAGVVSSVGPKIRRFKVGDRVWGSAQGLLGRQGTFAEYACVAEDFLYSTPQNVSDDDAAAAALVAITAHIGLFRCANLQAGETVFVNGGAGGVGSMVVQIAKASGAKVITTVGTPEKAAAVKQIGADKVINYKTDDVVASIKEYTQGQGVNVCSTPRISLSSVSRCSNRRPTNCVAPPTTSIAGCPRKNYKSASAKYSHFPRQPQPIASRKTTHSKKPARSRARSS
jgi:D-arabinose 1-dehydrogenase-like Zn-dependent alcohol dehydrogenase